jgi:hypothetical protein
MLLPCRLLASDLMKYPDHSLPRAGHATFVGIARADQGAAASSKPALERVLARRVKSLWVFLTNNGDLNEIVPPGKVSQKLV